MSKFISRSKKPIEPVWRQKNSAHISEKMNPELLAYLDSLPTELQEKIVVTSSTGDTHAKTSTHYKGAAFDLRIHNRDNPYLDDLFLYFMKDSENRKKNNIVVVDPNHGSAPHIHISVGQGTENELDFAYGNRWDNYIVKGEFKNSKDLWQSAMSNPVYGTLTANRFKDPSYTDAVLAGQPTDYNTSLDHSTSLDYNTDVDYNAFEDNEHKRRVLEELQQYQQLSAEKKIPDVLYDEKVIELLEKQAQRNNAANLIKDFLTLDYEYTNYSAEQPQQTQEVQYAENGGMIKYPNGGKVNPPIYVDSKNDPRYKAYQDSAHNYNTSIRALNKINQDKSFKLLNDKDLKKMPGNIKEKIIYNQNRFKEHKNTDPLYLQDYKNPYWGNGSDEYYQSAKKLLIHHNIDTSISGGLMDMADLATRVFTLGNSSLNRPAKNVFMTPVYDRPEQPVFLNNNNSSTNNTNSRLKTKPQQPVKVKPDPAIVAKQQQLIDAGYDIGEADGIWGKRSKEAWEKMQSANQPTEEETTTESTPTEDKKTIVEQYVQNLPKQKPIGYIQVQGRSIPYYTEEELEPFKKYKLTKIGSSNNYVISRHNEKTRGWTSSGELLDENNEVIYKTK